jgi:hypothetical protein
MNAACCCGPSGVVDNAIRIQRQVIRMFTLHPLVIYMKTAYLSEPLIVVGSCTCDEQLVYLEERVLTIEIGDWKLLILRFPAICL